MQGQANHFIKFAPEDVPYGEKRRSTLSFDSDPDSLIPVLVSLSWQVTSKRPSASTVYSRFV